MGDPQPSKAPLSGILFAIEELSHVSSRLTTRVICITLIGSIVPRKMSASAPRWLEVHIKMMAIAKRK